MGYQRKRKVYKLDFSDTGYDGLEVQVTGLTTGEYLDFVLLSSGATKEEGGNQETQQMLRMLSEHIVSWNLEDENGEPVPSTFEGLKSNDLDMNMFVVNAWIAAMSSVPEATEKKSLTGSTSLVESIPTEML